MSSWDTNPVLTIEHLTMRFGGLVAIDDLAALGPASIVYVACDPVALARDLSRFAGHGYRTGRVRGIDLFPHSHHMEAVALLGRDAAR